MATAAAEQHTDRDVVERAARLAVEDEEFDVEWPESGDTPSDEFRLAETAGKVGRHLLEHVAQFAELAHKDIVFVYRNKKDWRKDGRPKFGECKMQSGLNQFFAECEFTVVINWRVWRGLNAWQRVAAVYHELLHAEVDEDGKTSLRPHDFEVFREELELFGVRTYHDWIKLAETVGRGESVETQYHLPLLSVD